MSCFCIQHHQSDRQGTCNLKNIYCWVRVRYCYALYCLIDFLLVQINQTCLPLCHFRGNFVYHYMILSRAIRVAATHPSNILNGMRVAATHPSNEQCSEGGSNTPCTVTDEATSGAHPHPGVNTLRWCGGPTRPATLR